MPKIYKRSELTPETQRAIERAQFDPLPPSDQTWYEEAQKRLDYTYLYEYEKNSRELCEDPIDVDWNLYVNTDDVAVQGPGYEFT